MHACFLLETIRASIVVTMCARKKVFPCMHGMHIEFKGVKSRKNYTPSNWFFDCLFESQTFVLSSLSKIVDLLIQ
jgi:hypothetical protein